MKCQFCHSVLIKASRKGVGLEKDKSDNNRLKPIIGEFDEDGYEHVCHKSDGFCFLVNPRSKDPIQPKSKALVWNYQRFGNLINKVKADVILLLSE